MAVQTELPTTDVLEVQQRLATRSMTFLRRHGVTDSGRPHDPTRPSAG